MPRDPAIRFADMLEFAVKANGKAAAAGRDAFLQDEDLQVVWQTATVSLPGLIEQLKQILP